MSESKKPLVSYSVGPLSVALWENEKGKSVSVRKSYKKDGEWEEMTVYLNPQEVSCVAGLLARMEQEVIRESLGTKPEGVPF